jgi:hypothetical protein
MCEVSRVTGMKLPVRSAHPVLLLRFDIAPTFRERAQDSHRPPK